MDNLDETHEQTYDDSTMTMKINFWAAVAAIAGAATTLSA
jgi:hypothetical protein